MNAQRISRSAIKQLYLELDGFERQAKVELERGRLILNRDGAT
jgi:hypothetical protein